MTAQTIELSDTRDGDVVTLKPAELARFIAPNISMTDEPSTPGVGKGFVKEDSEGRTGVSFKHRRSTHDRVMRRVLGS